MNAYPSSRIARAVALSAIAATWIGCSSPSSTPSDAGRDAAVTVTDAGRPAIDASLPAIDAATMADAAAAIDAPASSADAGIIDTGTPCDAATYVRTCDGTGRMFYCDGTVRSLGCMAGSTCMMHVSGVGICIPTGLNFCDVTAFTPRCDGTTSIVYCSPLDSSLGAEARSSCGAGEACRTTPTGAACAAVGAIPCDEATFVDACGTDHRYHDCVSGFERVTDTCGAGYVCATISGSTYDCVDASLTPCTPAMFTESCEHAPEAAVLCSASGFVQHERCGTTNPTCTMVGAEAGCSYPGAAACMPTAPPACDPTDMQYLQLCSSDSIPRRRRCIAGTGMFASCACRTYERSPFLFVTDCLLSTGDPCASTDA